VPAASAPEFAAAIAPGLMARCTAPTCHVAGGVAPLLEPSVARAGLVRVTSLNVPTLLLVSPGRVRDSYLARKILGRRIPDRTEPMPSGCPDEPPASGCLDAAEIAAIVAWIERGAPNN
jgi:hypothetical protein